MDTTLKTDNGGGWRKGHCSCHITEARAEEKIKKDNEK